MPRRSPVSDDDDAYFPASEFSSAENVGIHEPHPHDVLCGRGGASNSHEGNKNWRRLVASNKELYVAIPKFQKQLLSQSIVHAVQSQNPPGRFLERDKDTQLWHIIADSKAIEKTSQALREGNVSIRASLEQTHGIQPDSVDLLQNAPLRPPMTAEELQQEGTPSSINIYMPSVTSSDAKRIAQLEQVQMEPVAQQQQQQQQQPTHPRMSPPVVPPVATAASNAMAPPPPAQPTYGGQYAAHGFGQATGMMHQPPYPPTTAATAYVTPQGMTAAGMPYQAAAAAGMPYHYPPATVHSMQPPPPSLEDAQQAKHFAAALASQQMNLAAATSGKTTTTTSVNKRKVKQQYPDAISGADEQQQQQQPQSIMLNIPSKPKAGAPKPTKVTSSSSSGGTFTKQEAAAAVSVVTNESNGTSKSDAPPTPMEQPSVSECIINDLAKMTSVSMMDKPSESIGSYMSTCTPLPVHFQTSFGSMSLGDVSLNRKMAVNLPKVDKNAPTLTNHERSKDDLLEDDSDEEQDDHTPSSNSNTTGNWKQMQAAFGISDADMPQDIRDGEDLTRDISGMSALSTFSLERSPSSTIMRDITFGSVDAGTATIPEANSKPAAAASSNTVTSADGSRGGDSNLSDQEKMEKMYLGRGASLVYEDFTKRKAKK